MGLVAGALGIQPHDRQTAEILRAADDVEEAAIHFAAGQGLEVRFSYTTDTDRHPNFLRITLADSTHAVEVSAVSIGGGNFEVLEQRKSKLDQRGA